MFDIFLMLKNMSSILIKRIRKRIGIHVLLQKKLSKGGGLLSFVSLLWMVANSQVIDFCISPMAY